MPTGDIYGVFNAQQIASKTLFEDWFLDFALEADKYLLDVLYGDVPSGIGDDKWTLLNVGATDGERRLTINTGITRHAFDGDHYVMTVTDGKEGTSTYGSQTTGCTLTPYESTKAVTYYVGVKRATYPYHVARLINGVDYAFDAWRESVGISGTPDAVVDDGDGTVTLTVTTMLASEVWAGGYTRKCVCWLREPATNGSSAICTTAEVAVVGAALKIAVPHQFGQTGTPSTTAADYAVVILGPIIGRAVAIKTGYEYFFIGTMLTGVGDTTDQPTVSLPGFGQAEDISVDITSFALLTGTDVQMVLEELDDHCAGTAHQHNATAIVFTPVGGFDPLSITAALALAELESEKLQCDGTNYVTGDIRCDGGPFTLGTSTAAHQFNMHANDITIYNSIMASAHGKTIGHSTAAFTGKFGDCSFGYNSGKLIMVGVGPAEVPMYINPAAITAATPAFSIERYDGGAPKARIYWTQQDASKLTSFQLNSIAGAGTGFVNTETSTLQFGESVDARILTTRATVDKVGMGILLDNAGATEDLLVEVDHNFDTSNHTRFSLLLGQTGLANYEQARIVLGDPATDWILQAEDDNTLEELFKIFLGGYSVFGLDNYSGRLDMWLAPPAVNIMTAFGASKIASIRAGVLTKPYGKVSFETDVSSEMHLALGAYNTTNGDMVLELDPSGGAAAGKLTLTGSGLGATSGLEYGTGVTKIRCISGNAFGSLKGIGALPDQLEWDVYGGGIYPYETTAGTDVSRGYLSLHFLPERAVIEEIYMKYDRETADDIVRLILYEKQTTMSIHSAAIVDGGTGYTPGAGQAMTVGGGGSGATVTCDIDGGGTVTDIYIGDGGEDFPLIATLTPPGAGSDFEANVQMINTLTIKYQISGSSMGEAQTGVTEDTDALPLTMDQSTKSYFLELQMLSKDGVGKLATDAYLRNAFIKYQPIILG